MTALLGLATRLGLARLMLITGTRAEVGDLAGFIDAGFAGGVDLVQLRDPDKDDDALLAALKVMREVGYRYQGLVSVYDSGALAEKFGADLLHLSERGEKADGGPAPPAPVGPDRTLLPLDRPDRRCPCRPAT